MVIEKLTGLHIQYYFICPRKLWFYHYKLNMELESELVKIGRYIESFYKRDKYMKEKIILDDFLSLDILEKEKEFVYIIEIKKSSKMEEAIIWQLKYYLWYLSKKGLKVKGKLVIPEEKIEKIIELSKDDEYRLKQIIKEIMKIINSDKPPKVDKKPYCKKCSYKILCLEDEI